ncbi:MAG: aldo/keto reductase [Paracoccaceae bacterium]|nr:aldo/keto reductase [Paracoccaceae bacterium]
MARYLKRRRLGRTKVELTELGLGTAPFGEPFVRLEDDGVAAAIERAWTSGIRYFDTSPFYGHGKSELRVGRGLGGRDRDAFVLSTKVGRLLRRPADPTMLEPGFFLGGLPFEVRFDYSYDGIMRSVEDSYQRLGMNRIDLLLIHDLDTWFHPTNGRLEAYRAQLLTSGAHALNELRSSGVISAVGAGINECGMIPWFVENMDLDFFLVALRYSLLEQETLDVELPLCAERGIGIVIGGVFNSGILATGAREGAMYNYEPAGREILEHVSKLEAVCRSHGVNLHAAALQFPLAHPLVASVIPGAHSAAHIEQIVAGIDQPIPETFWLELKERGLIRPDAPVPDQHSQDQDGP